MKPDFTGLLDSTIYLMKKYAQTLRCRVFTLDLAGRQCEKVAKEGAFAQIGHDLVWDVNNAAEYVVSWLFTNV